MFKPKLIAALAVLVIVFELEKEIRESTAAAASDRDWSLILLPLAFSAVSPVGLVELTSVAL